MAQKQRLEDLQKRWLHSHEEDSGADQVYRPADFAFPPARGRTGFELSADKSCKLVGIAASDGSSVAEGRWELEENDELQLRLDCQSETRRLTVVSLDDDRLVVRRENES